MITAAEAQTLVVRPLSLEQIEAVIRHRAMDGYQYATFPVGRWRLDELSNPLIDAGYTVKAGVVRSDLADLIAEHVADLRAASGAAANDTGLVNEIGSAMSRTADKWVAATRTELVVVSWE